MKYAPINPMSQHMEYQRKEMKPSEMATSLGFHWMKLRKSIITINIF